MELEEFRRNFLADARSRAVSEKDFVHEAFRDHCAGFLGEAGELADVDGAHFRGKGTRNRSLAVDGYCFDEADGSVRLLVVEHDGGDQPASLTRTWANEIFGRLRAFVEDSMDGRFEQEREESHPAYDLARHLREGIGGLSRIHLFLVTDLALSERAKDWPEGDIRGIPVEFHIWDISRFHRVAESRTGRDEVVVDFREFVADGLPCLDAGRATGGFRSYLCVVPGDVLAKLYGRFGSRLLEGNVRSFLSFRGRINQGIRSTIVKEPGMFFAFNNGIAATCADAEIVEAKGGRALVAVTDLQIVNGGQTTASISAMARTANLGDVHVPMKLTVVSLDTADEVIPRISRCANSQNRVSDADFFATHPFHRRLEDISRRLLAPPGPGSGAESRWFYERARGQFLNEHSRLSAADQKRWLALHPRNQVLTKTDIAKFENAWAQLPHVVSRGAQKNFMAHAEAVTRAWDERNEDFNDEHFRTLVGKAILFRAAEALVSESDWYQAERGYRAQVVAYAVSRLARLVEQATPGRFFDFAGLWRRQSPTESTLRQIATISRMVQQVIVSPPENVRNVGEWCKKDLCWQRAREAAVPLLPEFEAELITGAEAKAVRREGRSLRKVDSGIEAQREVLALGGAYWQALRSWASQRRKLSPDEDRLVGRASTIPRSLPTEKESIRLLAIRERLEADGYDMAKAGN